MLQIELFQFSASIQGVLGLIVKNVQNEIGFNVFPPNLRPIY